MPSAANAANIPCNLHVSAIGALPSTGSHSARHRRPIRTISSLPPGGAACETAAVSARRLLPLVLAVAGLLAVAALASHGRPLSASRGTGPTSHFFDYVFTTVALFVIAVALVFLLSLLTSKPATPGRQRPKFDLWQYLLMLATSFLVGWFLLHAHLHPPLKAKQPARQTKTGTAGALGKEPPAASTRGARLRWDAVATVAPLPSLASRSCSGGRSSASTRRTRPRATMRSMPSSHSATSSGSRSRRRREKATPPRRPDRRSNPRRRDRARAAPHLSP